MEVIQNGKSGLDTGIAAKQLNLLFDIRAIFKRRGQQVVSCEDESNLLFRITPHEFNTKHFKALGHSSFRRIVSAIANSENQILSLTDICCLCPDLTHQKMDKRLQEAQELGMIIEEDQKYRPSKPVSFGPTLEWFVAATCVKDLDSIAYWGVKVQGLEGDYDVVVIRENQVGYIECKSGKAGNIDETHIVNFLQRERLLAPRFSVYLVDGISKDKVGNLVEYALKQNEEYLFEIPFVMESEISLQSEEYKNFIRLVPINSFFVSVNRPIDKVLLEIYEFMTLVCDRMLVEENRAGKAKFR